VTFESWLAQELNAQREKNLFRELRTTSNLIDFCSNDYLGLAKSAQLYERIIARLEEFSAKQNGSTGSRLLSGNSPLIEAVEARLATIFKSEAALILNSGYTANLAIFSSIPQRNDTILFDELAHASIKDGTRLSLAKRYSFRHNDLNDLEARLKRASGNIFIAVESIYSMDGDESPLSELVGLAKKHGAFIVLDEAHSTGTRGLNGGGIATSLGIENDIAVRLYTFGKAMGVHGACIAGSKKLMQYFINFARPFIYTTALSPHSVASVDCAFDYLQKNMHLQAELAQNTKTFLEGVAAVSNRTKSTSAIQTWIVPGNDHVREAASSLQLQGFDIRPILSPTVPAGSERLRICLHSYNTSLEITKLTAELQKLELRHA
jgi:8-amino-7-oxononanoate synthase